MTEFVRVRDDSTKAEYDVAKSYVAAFPEGLTVIDDKPVQQPRPAVHGGKAKPSAEPKTESKSVGDNRKAGI